MVEGHKPRVPTWTVGAAYNIRRVQVMQSRMRANF